MILFFFKNSILKSPKKSTIRLICIICFLASLISSFALILVMNIMSGFHEKTWDRFFYLSPHLVIPKVSEENFRKNLKEFSSFNFSWNSYESQVLFLRDSLGNAAPILFTGMSEEALKALLKDVFSGQKISYTGAFFDSSEFHHVSLFEKDIIDVFPPSNLLINPEDMQFKEVLVNRIFPFSYRLEGEAKIYLKAYYFLEKMKFPWDKQTQFIDSGIEIRLKNKNKLDHLYHKIKKFYPHASSIKQTYSMHFSALEIEKKLVFFILILGILITSLNLLSAVSLFLNQKKKEMNILRVLGLSVKKLSYIFSSVNLLFSCSGLFIGGFLGLLMSFILEKYPLNVFPDLYLFSELPVQIDFLRNLLSFMFFLSVAFLSSFIPIKLFKHKAICYYLRLKS